MAGTLIVYRSPMRPIKVKCSNYIIKYKEKITFNVNIIVLMIRSSHKRQ